jgi:hypothetical protein
MGDGNQFSMGLVIGMSLGMVIIGLIVILATVLGGIYRIWHDGRDLAQTVTENKHKRRVQLLAKMIELEQARRLVREDNDIQDSFKDKAKQRGEK